LTLTAGIRSYLSLKKYIDSRPPTVRLATETGERARRLSPATETGD
jgi:hypothetical protein